MKIGIIGAGQLGQMLAQAGISLGMQFSFLDPTKDACAASLGKHFCNAYDDKEALAELAKQVDVVTFEFENVPSETVAFLSDLVPVYPHADSLKIARDRWLEKNLFKSLDIPTPLFANIESQKDLEEAIMAIGFPAVLKTRTLGYDGKGQKILKTTNDIINAYAALGNVPCILEHFVNFSGEVSLIAVRNQQQQIKFYPLSQNKHQQGILRLSVASEQHPLQPLAESYVSRVLERLDYIGVLAFEFFEVADGLMANEIAPRVHNSGHWTIEGSITSQFENHLRAIANLPLGSTNNRGYSAMINFIGSIPSANQLLAIENCHLHNYSKAFRTGRKVGHATLNSSSMDRLELLIAQVQGLINE